MERKQERRKALRDHHGSKAQELRQPIELDPAILCDY
jgi:hypothetical protein